MAKVSRNLGLDPETDYEQIARNLSLYEFPWDMVQALSFALFRTYAVPSIGGLLDRSRGFAEDTQKRYDDTALLLEEPLDHGMASVRGRAAIRRINQMHRRYDISNDDMRYVLATFVVVPRRWIAEYGWRDVTDAEVLASVRYFQALGRHLGIKGIPATYDEFADLMDTYEADHFGYDEGARRVADVTLDLLASFYPRPLRRGVLAFSRALMDDPLLDAFGYPRPGKITRRLATGSLKARARVVARLSARRKPLRALDMARVKSYPNGYLIEQLGTFAPGCPVPHGPGGRTGSLPA